jgi:hypothetical protein
MLGLSETLVEMVIGVRRLDPWTVGPDRVRAYVLRAKCSS